MTTVEPFTQQDVALLNARHFTLQTPAVQTPAVQTPGVQTPGVHDTGVYNTGAAVSPGGQVTVTRARAGYLLNLGGIQENTVHMGLVDAMNLAERWEAPLADSVTPPAAFVYNQRFEVLLELAGDSSETLVNALDAARAEIARGHLMGENVNYRYSQTNPAPGHTPEFIERLPGEPLRYGRRFQNSLQAARLIGLKPDEADDHYNEVLDLCQQGRLVPMYDHPAVNALEVFARPGELLQAWETASGQKVTGVSQQRLSLPSSAVVPGGIALQAFHTRTLTVLTGSQDSSQDSSVLSAVFLDRKLVAVLDHTQPEEQALAAAAMTGRWTLQGGAVLERARQVQLKLDEQP